MSPMAVLLIVAGIAVLAAIHLWRSRRVAEERNRYVAPLTGTIEDMTLDLRSMDYPIVHGRYRGTPVAIEPHLDAMQVRKLPTLWLFVTVERPLRTGGTLSLMMRPRSAEYWSPFNDLDEIIEPSSGFPDHTNIRASNARAAGLASVLPDHRDFLADPKAKEILITPKGVRLVWLAEEAERATYMVTRQASLSGAPIPVAAVVALIERALQIAETVERMTGGRQGGEHDR